jgi:hypothetical protein
MALIAGQEQRERSLEETLKRRGSELGHAAARVRTLREELAEARVQVEAQKSALDEADSQHTAAMSGTVLMWLRAAATAYIPPCIELNSILDTERSQCAALRADLDASRTASAELLAAVRTEAAGTPPSYMRRHAGR